METKNTNRLISNQNLLPSPKETEIQIVHRADHLFPFLHDVMIAPLLGKLFMAWYNCTEGEIVGHTVIRGRWSADGGRTWSDPEIVAQDNSEQNLHLVPVTFQEWDGVAYAYCTVMQSHDRPIGFICCRYECNSWNVIKQYDTPFLFNTLVDSLEDGTCIAAGRMAAEKGGIPLIPAIAIAPPKAPADWRIFPLSTDLPASDFPYPETTLINGKNVISAFVRGENEALVYHSIDHVTNWDGPYPANIPALGSKMCGGVLSSGRQYLLYNHRVPSGERTQLILALRNPGKEEFDSFYLLRDGYDKTLDAGPFWHYPCACEYEGALFICCTASGKSRERHAALLRIPISNI